MMEYLNDHRVRLTPDAPTKRRAYKRPVKKLNQLETEIVETIKAAIRGQVEKEAWLLKQLRRSREYELSLERRGYRREPGMPGWQPGPAGTKIMIHR